METRWSRVLCKGLTLAIALVLFAVGGNVAWAESDTDCFTYIVFPAGAFPGFPGDIARAADGQTIQMAGSGPLCIHPKSVGGGGTFTHKNAAGAVVAAGTWTAVELSSFTDYGTNPAFPPVAHGGSLSFGSTSHQVRAALGLTLSFGSTARLISRGPPTNPRTSGRGYGSLSKVARTST